MAGAVTVYYSLASPWTYLGWARFREIAALAGADVLHRPIDMRPVFQASGGLPLAQRPRQRQAYRLMELRRWRERLGLPLNLEPRHFPTDERPAARMVIAHGRRGGDVSRLSEAFLRAVWTEERDIADPATLRSIAAENGADGEALVGIIDDDQVTAEYRANAQAAIDAGVFGVPTYVIGGELFWGQDRLDFVERALR
jgi:2-hydroxychromene-2-carboxylate isomerase